MSAHHRSHRSSRSSHRSAMPLVGIFLALIAVFVVFTLTVEPPTPDAPPRSYPGTSKDYKSTVLPKTAREASDEFHRKYDDPEEVADEGDPVAESRRRNREQAEQQAARHQQQKLDKDNPPVQKPAKADARTTKAKPTSKENPRKKK